MRRHYHFRKKRRVGLLVLLVLLLGMVLLFEFQLKPILKSFAANQAQQTATQAIETVVNEQLEKQNYTYQDFISITYGDDGRVLSLTGNMAAINKIKSQVTTAVQDYFAHQHIEVSVPLGTVMGSELFHGKGPGIPITVSLAGNIASDFQNSFESAGINQTCHRIYLEFTAELYTFVPGVDATTTVTTEVMIAETVIVGEVPQILQGIYSGLSSSQTEN